MTVIDVIDLTVTLTSVKNRVTIGMYKVIRFGEHKMQVTNQSTQQSTQQSRLNWSIESIKTELSRLTGYDFSTARRAKDALLDLFDADVDGLNEIYHLNLSKKESWVKLMCFVQVHFSCIDYFFKGSDVIPSQFIYQVIDAILNVIADSSLEVIESLEYGEIQSRFFGIPNCLTALGNELKSQVFYNIYGWKPRNNYWGNALHEKISTIEKLIREIETTENQPCTQLIYMVFEIQMKSLTNYLRLQAFQYEAEFQELHFQDISGFLALAELAGKLANESFYWQLYFLDKIHCIGCWMHETNGEKEAREKMEFAINQIEEFLNCFYRISANHPFMHICNVIKPGKENDVLNMGTHATITPMIEQVEAMQELVQRKHFKYQSSSVIACSL